MAKDEHETIRMKRYFHSYISLCSTLTPLDMEYVLPSGHTLTVMASVLDSHDAQEKILCADWSAGQQQYLLTTYKLSFEPSNAATRLYL